MTTEVTLTDEQLHEMLVGDIRQALVDASRRMKVDPMKKATYVKHVYPLVGKGKWLGTKMYVWRLVGARRPLFIGYDNNLYYRFPDGNFIPARFEKRDNDGLIRLFGLIRVM